MHKRYDPELKREVLAAVLEHGVPVHIAAQVFALPGKFTVYSWIRAMRARPLPGEPIKAPLDDCAPCDDCEFRRRCAERGASCSAFRNWVYSGRATGSRLPTGDLFSTRDDARKWRLQERCDRRVAKAASEAERHAQQEAAGRT
jgi:transposase-like protein